MWLGSPLSLRVSELQVDSFADFFDAMANFLNQEQLELLRVICWKLWECRNSALWDNKPVVPSQIIEKALFSLTEYTIAISSRGRGVAGVQRLSETKWRPPTVGFTKINVDGAVFEQQSLHGIGVVAHDSDGEVLATMISKGQGLFRLRRLKHVTCGKL
ncbi:hypothetical protein SLE2022_116960 [Rubroshorea leprosula]